MSSRRFLLFKKIKGKITHDPEASIEKIARQKLKYPPIEKIGFQLLGMRVK